MSKYGIQGWPSTARRLTVYQYGQEFSTVTGGWVTGTGTGGCTMTKLGGSLRGVAPASNSTYGTWVASNWIDFTPFRWQYIEVNIADMAEGCFYGGGPNKTTRPMDTAGGCNWAIVGNTGTGVSVLRNDISTYNRYLYPYFYVGGANYGSTSGTMDMLKMWFE